MNRYESVKVDVTHHAYLQYCERVGEISGEELSHTCRQQLKEGNFSQGKGGWFLEIGGVWWVYKVDDGILKLLTCYGRTTMDLPKALKWAKRNNDNIDLQNLISPRPEVPL